MIVLYPEALNQRPFALDIRTFTHELLLLIVWLPVVGIAFLVTLWVLMVYKAFAGQVSLQVAIKASLRVGLAVYFFLPLYQMPFVMLGPGDASAIIGLSLDGFVLVLGIIAAVQVVRCARIHFTI